MIDTSSAGLLDLAAALGLLSLGGLVWALRGRDLAASSFGALCLGLAVFYLHARTVAADGGPLIPWPLTLLGAALLGWGFVGIAVLVPRPFGARDRTAALGGAFALAVLAIVVAAGLLADPAQLRTFNRETGPMTPLLQWAHYAAAVVGFASLTVFPLRFAATRPEEEAERRSLALLALGVTLFTAGVSTYVLFAPAWRPISTALMVAVLAPTALWILATRAPGGRLARRMALVVPAILLEALLLALVAPDLVYPVHRVLGVAVLGYAVLSGQIQGLDVKVRFALSRTTVAAVFIAVFFVASEAAQEFFGDTLGSSYVGILAAGALVFAIAPLSRLADRVAEKAVPVAEAAPAAASGINAAEAAFRDAARLALRDRVLSREEERTLVRLAEQLRIAPSRAMAVIDEIEREATHARR